MTAFVIAAVLTLVPLLMLLLHFILALVVLLLLYGSLFCFWTSCVSLVEIAGAAPKSCVDIVMQQ